MELIQTFLVGETGQDSVFGVTAGLIVAIGAMERIFVGCGGNLMFVFKEFALFCVIVFLVITGPSLIFALPVPNE